MKKNPWLAAILNFFLFGVGTLYVGGRTAVGVLLLIGGTMAQIVEIKVSPPIDNSLPALWPFLFSGLVLVKIALAIDGYRAARAVSEGAK